MIVSMWYLFLFFICVIVAILIAFLNNIKSIIFKSSSHYNYSNNSFSSSNKYYKYISKSFISRSERYFYNILKKLENDYHIRVHPQVSLASIVDKVGNYKFSNELYRIIDFGIFSEDYSTLLFVIEINDSSHLKKNRYYRDKKVRAILDSANIKLVTFYTNCSNTEEYVRNRIIDTLKLKNDKLY